eukprot:8489266-Heterocapsa_arctica.AAC.1
MSSDNLLNKVEFKDTGVHGLLPTTTFAGKAPEGKRNILEQSGKVPADGVKDYSNEFDEHILQQNTYIS